MKTLTVVSVIISATATSRAQDIPMNRNATDAIAAMGVQSGFAKNRSYTPYNNEFLRGAVLRFAEAIKCDPKARVWSVERSSGEVVLYIGNYGNVRAEVSLGEVKNSASSTRLEYINKEASEKDPRKDVPWLTPCKDTGNWWGWFSKPRH